MSGRISFRGYQRQQNDGDPQHVLYSKQPFSFEVPQSDFTLNDNSEFPSLSGSTDRVQDASKAKVQMYSDKLKSPFHSSADNHSVSVNKCHAGINRNHNSKSVVPKLSMKPDVKFSQNAKRDVSSIGERLNHMKTENKQSPGLKNRNFHSINNQKGEMLSSNLYKPGSVISSSGSIQQRTTVTVKHNVHNAKPSNEFSAPGCSSGVSAQPSNESQPNKGIKCKLLFDKVKLNQQGEKSDDPAKTTKKRKRKSKVKRQAALQTGKINLLTPEVHLKILNQGNAPASKNVQSLLTDLSNEDEYPELGKLPVPPASWRMNTLKEENSSTSTLEDEKVSNLAAIMQEVAVISESIESKESVMKEKKKKSDNKPAHLKDPITFSLIDMLVTKSAMPKEKEPKDEIATPLTQGSLKVKAKKDSCHAPNSLDSSGPLVKRGKERETPKLKKPSHLKKVILLDRKLRKEHLLQIKSCANQEQNLSDGIENEICESSTSCDENVEPPLSDVFQGENNQELTSSLSSHLHDLSLEIPEVTPLSTSDETGLDLSKRKVVLPDNGPSNKTSSENNLDEESHDSLLRNFRFIAKCDDASYKGKAAKILLHTRNFREYCDHLISQDIDDVVHALLDDLARFQDRLHQKDPVKARAKRRMIYGVKEVKKYVKLKKMKCIIIATDIENVETEGGLNDILNDIKTLAAEHNVPSVFALGRKALGKVCHKPVPVSCIGVLNSDGSEANYKKILELVSQSRTDYLNVLNDLVLKVSEEETDALIKARREVPKTLHDLRSNILRRMFLSSQSEGIENSGSEALNCEFTESSNSD